jgi:glycerol-3-phosphate acyltransferase PlsY
MGHSKSIFLGFTGGKSVACGVGSITGLYMPVGFITMGLWAVITYFSKYVSVGSIIAVMLMPILMFVFKQPLSYICYCLLVAFYITYLHRENIKRLLKGNESKVR